MRDPSELADRYVALWNEPDPDQRRQLIEELWTEDGAQILQPPQEIREIAARPGIGLSATLEARGHAALEARATSVHNEFVAAGGFRFRRRDKRPAHRTMNAQACAHTLDQSHHLYSLN
jgi:hypothetical protein